MTAEMSSQQASQTQSKPPKRYVPMIARILMGLGFLVFGLNGFLQFIPQPKAPPPQAAMDFAGALMKTGYMMKLIAGTQVVVGALLLLNLFVPLALTLIAPVIVNILAFHIFLAPGTIIPGAIFAGLELYLAWAYRRSFGPMLNPLAKPS